METGTSATKLSLVVLALGMCITAYGQAPVIESLSKNGELICTNLVPGTVASVEWAPSVTGPWTNNWAGLDAVTVDSNGMMQVSVPMFYRVRGTGAPPAGMALIPAGAFTMGDTLDGYGNAIPMSVTVSAFYMDRNEVSYNQWTNVYAYATNHGYGFLHAGLGKAWNHPVQTVNWYDSVKWSNARSEQAGLTPVYYTDAGLTQVYTNGDIGTTVYPNWAANGYRLPTEAEWEKAARGGLSGQRFPWGDTITHSQANYYSSASYPYDISPTRGYHPDYDDVGSYTSPVGSFAANGYGLYDMAGNVLEWCWDWYGTPYGQPTTTNPTGPADPLNGRVVRGGLKYSGPGCPRCANRNGLSPGFAFDDIGFRCVRGL